MSTLAAENAAEQTGLGDGRRRPPGLSRWLVNLGRLLVLVVLYLLWYAVAGSVFFHVDPLLLPSPNVSFSAFGSAVASGQLLGAAGTTLEGAAIGFVIGMVVGVLLGIGIGRSRYAYAILQPFITILNSMPRIALAPLFVLWFGVGQTSAVALVVSIVIFIAVTNLISATQAIEPTHLLVARLYGATPRQTTLKIILPATVPWIVAATRLSIANSLAGAIVAEMFLGDHGLGYLIVNGSGVFNMGQVFAAIIAALILAAVLDWLGTLAERRLLRWRPHER